MKKSKIILKTWTLALLVFPLFLIGQNHDDFKPKINWNMTGQIWLRYSDLNDGSLVNNEPTSELTDISIRRIRIPISSQVTPKIYMYSILGGNNYNYQNKDFNLEILDLYVEYTFDNYLSVGFGKSGWLGLNRWNIRSSYSMMGLDSPLFTLNTVEKTDDLGRLFGGWLKGQVGKFDYRLSFKRSLSTSTAPTGKVDFANNRPRIRTSSYVKYQFFDHESNKSAYQAGTYLQNKKVLNIGAGFQHQAKSMSDGDVNDASTNFYDMEHWAIDSFLNLPLANNDAITAYLGYYDYGFGKNYIRNIGADNPTNGGGDDFNGHGIAFPMIGTGTSWYTQFGYAFKQTNLFNHQVIIQPNFAIQHSKWDALPDHMTVYDLTVNFLVNGSQGNKISLGYQHRPIFDAITLRQKDYKAMAVLQYQISLK